MYMGRLVASYLAFKNKGPWLNISTTATARWNPGFALKRKQPFDKLGEKTAGPIYASTGEQQ